MRLRRKFTLAFFVVSSLVCVVLALVLYRFLALQLEAEARFRLADIARIGAAEVEDAPYRRLAGKLGDLPPAAVDAVEHSDDYAQLSAHLGMLRAAEPTIVRYAYLLAPGADPDHPRFVADADVLAYDALVAQGKPLPEGESISHFAQPYDVSQIPLLREALVDCHAEVEHEFVADPEFHVGSLSAYMPLTDDAGQVMRDARGRCLGVLGVDFTDAKMQKALAHARKLALRISIAALALALLVSLAMGTLLTRSLRALSAAVQRFAAKDFAARTPPLSRDEIGELGASFNAMADTIQQHSEHLEVLVDKRTAELQAEKATSERLLLNVLPAPIADRLKGGASLIVDRFEAVTVLFADLVGFTALSASTTPEQLVTMLDELFSRFDRLAEAHGLEKIKTIGDAYMVVAGIPQPHAEHAAAIARMGLDMLAAVADYAQRTGAPLAIRIGVHTGPVVAGVIGQKKFIYDLWGDTVNTASRMESHGVPGRVHVTEATAGALADAFELEPRGPIDVKGKGVMRTFLVVGLRAPSTAAPAT